MWKLEHQRLETIPNEAIDLFGWDTLNLPFLFSLYNFFILLSISLKNF